MSERDNPRRAKRVLLWIAMFALVGSTAFAATLTVTSANLTSYRTCTLTANPNTTTAEVDSYVDQLLATTNNGTATSLSVTSLSLGNRRTFLQFDLTKCSPAIASTATVKVALLRLYVSSLPIQCRVHDIYRVTASWTETGITWNNQPAVAGSRTDTINVGGGSCTNSTANQYVTGWNVLADVQAYVAATATNNGWMIRDGTESSAVAQAATYSSKDLGTLAQAPQLIVTYV